MKIRPVGVELFRADGRTDRRTDMQNLLVAFANAPKSEQNSQRGTSVGGLDADGTLLHVEFNQEGSLYGDFAWKSTAIC